MDVEDRNDDVIELNVGGTVMATKRSTLCQVENTYLASMFGGSWDETKMARDKDGRVFLDFSPKHFAVILDFLRWKAVKLSETPLLFPKIDPEEFMSFVQLVDYLGLSSDEMRLLRIPTTEAFELHNEGIKLEENGALASTGDGNIPRRVVGQNVYELGVFRITLGLEYVSLQRPDRSITMGELGIGVIKELENKISDYPPVAFFGWGISKKELRMYSSKTIKRRIISFSGGDYDDFVKQVKRLELVLDCDKAKLYLNTKDGKQFNVDLPKWTKYRLFVQWGESDNCKIRIVDFHRKF